MKFSPLGVIRPIDLSHQLWTRCTAFLPLMAAVLVAGQAVSTTAHAVDAGDLDTSFNTDGIVVTDIAGRSDTGEAVAVQDDGKIVVAGASRLGVNSTIVLVRYNPDGSLDTDFDNDGIVTAPVLGPDDAAFAVAIQDDDKIVAGGRTWNGFDFDFVLVRYETDGTLDTTFGANGIVTTAFAIGSNDEAFAIAIQNDGKIVLAGSTGSGLLSAFALARYETDGSLDTTFGPGGLVVTDLAGPDRVRSIAVQADARIVAAGFSFNGVDDDVAIVRYRANGSLDPGFGINGIVEFDLVSSDERATGVAIQSNARIVVSGFTNSNTAFDFLMLRLLSDGSLDTSFGSTGIVISDLQGADDLAQDLTLQSDGKIVVAGSSNSTGNIVDDEFAVVRYATDGSLDSSFGNNGVVVTVIGTLADLGLAITLQPDGRIVVAGVADAGPDLEIAVARYRDVAGASSVIPGGSNGGCTLSTGATGRDLSLMALLLVVLALRRQGRTKT